MKYFKDIKRDSIYMFYIKILTQLMVAFIHWVLTHIIK